MRREQWRITCDQPHCTHTARAPHNTPDPLALFQRVGWFVTRHQTGDICPACLHHGAHPAPRTQAYRGIRRALKTAS